MGTYTIPRNLKGETRLLIIFSTKSLITTAAGLVVGLIFYAIIAGIFAQQTAAIIVAALFALIGFGVGTVKIPTVSGLPITKKIGGESIDVILGRYFKFKMKKKRYAYYITKEGNK